jgi:hypothetical protein
MSKLKLGLCILLVMLVVTGPGCRSGREDFTLFRIIDRLGPENVVKSPLRKPDPENAILAEVVGQFPLEDLGAGPNPFLIKKKLHVGAADVNALAAIPPTEICFRLKVPSHARLEFNYGIRHDKEIFRAGGGERRAEFSVILTSKGREQRIFKKALILGRVLVFNNKEIDLARYAGQDVEFRLITEGDGKALAFWLNPVIFQVRPDSRYIVLISIDTLRADHLGCYGYGRDTSPNLDALAGDSVRFENVMAASPWTLPSHMSLMTSLNSISHGVAAPGYRLNPDVPTLAELLKTRGFYNVAITGGGFVSGFFGFCKGFDSYRALGAVTDSDAAGRLYASASRWIEDNLEKSFFLFLHTYQVHNPFDSGEPNNKRYLRSGAAYEKIGT